jgi:hypothetical protein
MQYCCGRPKCLLCNVVCPFLTLRFFGKDCHLLVHLPNHHRDCWHVLFTFPAGRSSEKGNDELLRPAPHFSAMSIHILQKLGVDRWEHPVLSELNRIRLLLIYAYAYP